MTRELKGFQSSNIHVAYINRKIKPEEDKYYVMLGAAFHSNGGFDDGSQTPKIFKVFLGRLNLRKT
jgi:hypothetical protein